MIVIVDIDLEIMEAWATDDIKYVCCHTAFARTILMGGAFARRLVRHKNSLEMIVGEEIEIESKHEGILKGRTSNV